VHVCCIWGKLAAGMVITQLMPKRSGHTGNEKKGYELTRLAGSLSWVLPHTVVFCLVYVCTTKEPQKGNHYAPCLRMRATIAGMSARRILCDQLT